MGGLTVMLPFEGPTQVVLVTVYVTDNVPVDVILTGTVLVQPALASVTVTVYEPAVRPVNVWGLLPVNVTLPGFKTKV